MRGKRIKTLKQVVELALKRKSVEVGMIGSMPAAFFMNWQGYRIHQAIEHGVYEYKPDRKGDRVRKIPDFTVPLKQTK